MPSRALKIKLLAALVLACLAHGSARATAPHAATPRAGRSSIRGAARQKNPARPPRVEGELLVRLDKSSSRESLRAAHARLGARVVEEFPALGWARVVLPKGAGVDESIKFYEGTPGVLAAQPNYVYRIDNTPNDARYAELYGIQKIGAPAAWDLSTGSAAVVVAVIDTGVRYTHEDLAPNVWTNPGEIAANGIDDDGDGFIDDVYGWDFDHNDADPDDDNGHGTHVSGTIGAVGNNSLGVVGVNWNVRLLALKTHDSSGNSTSAKVIAAFNYVTMLKARGVNVRVTSNSWGGAPEAPAYDQALSDAVAAAGAANILNVFAAGNANTDTDAQPFYPASYKVQNVVSVAASDQNDNRASFSNYGATSVDLAAPGVGILSTSRQDAPNNYVSLSGTSMAAPHVAGAAALLAAHQPSLSAASLKATLLGTVDQLSQWSGKTLAGGRLNVARALQTPTACSYQLSADNISVPSSGYESAFGVTAQANCDWSAKSNDSWITITAVTQPSGSGFVNFSVAPSDAPQRAGTITVAGLTFTVTQVSGCSFSVSPASLPQFPAAGGNGSFQMTTGAGCQWTAASAAEWITITNGAGAGAGAVTFTVAPNATQQSRTGQIIRTDDSSYAITQAAALPTSGQVIITEFRIDGAAGAADEFYEIYNATDNAMTVAADDSSAGWSLAAWFTSGGATFTQTLCTIPNGAVIPARGHYLCANNFTDANNVPRGYSLADYGGAGRAAPDRATTGAGLSADGVNVVLDGLALFRSSLSFTLSNRLDAVGTNPSIFGFTPASEGQPISYRGEFNSAAQYSWVRKVRAGLPQDTDDSASDFSLVSTNAAVLGGVQAILGAPAPENSSSPRQRNALTPASLIDPKCGGGAGSGSKVACQNAVRDVTDTGANKTLGTLSVRRRFTNKTGAPVTFLRFRVVDITTLGSPPGIGARADLRVLSSADATARTRDGKQFALRGAALEEPPAQALGGGLNSSLTLDLSSSPLAPGATIDVQFLLGVMREGKYSFAINVESLP
ncbi:MAG: S8 family serine peptidase [Pyrinomonadaceae bacterium]